MERDTEQLRAAMLMRDLIEQQKHDGKFLEADENRELNRKIRTLETYGAGNPRDTGHPMLQRFYRQREAKLSAAGMLPHAADFVMFPPNNELPKPAPARPADQDEQVDPDLNTGRRAPRRRPSTRTLLKVVAAMALFGLGALFNQATGGPAPRDTSSAAALPLAVTVPSPSPSAKAKPTPTPETKRVVPADCKDANYYGNELITLHYAYVDAVGDLLTAYTQGNEAGIKKARDTMDKNHEKMAAAADSFRLGNHACQ